MAGGWAGRGCMSGRDPSEDPDFADRRRSRRGRYRRRPRGAQYRERGQRPRTCHQRRAARLPGLLRQQLGHGGHRHRLRPDPGAREQPQEERGARAGQRPATAAAAVPCGTEPDCNLPYGGGPVQHTPHVYLVFWGPKWGTSTYTATENFVKSFFTDLGQPSDYWSTTVEQYTDKTGHPTFGKSAAGQHVLGQSHPGEVGQRHQPRHRGGGGHQLAAHHRHQRRQRRHRRAAGHLLRRQRRRHLRRQLRDTPGERLLRLPRLGRQHGELQPPPAVGQPPLPARRRGRLRPDLHQHAGH